MDVHSHVDGSGGESTPKIYFKEVLASLLKDTFRDEGELKERTKIKMRKAWEDVLPPPTSRAGSKLSELFDRHQISTVEISRSRFLHFS